jgi:hypothetical protein
MTSASSSKVSRVGSAQPAPSSGGASAGGFALQELWFVLQQRPWRTLVVVPGHAGGDALPVARSVVDVGSRLARGGAPWLLEAQKIDLASAAEIIQTMEGPGSSSAWTSGGNKPIGGEQVPSKIVIALEPVVRNPLGLAIALAADAVLMVVDVGITDLPSARRTVELIGRERFCGTVLVNGK